MRLIKPTAARVAVGVLSAAALAVSGPVALLAPGGSMTITLTLTAIATGTDNFSSYARLTNLGGVTSTGTLTIS